MKKFLILIRYKCLEKCKSLVTLLKTFIFHPLMTSIVKRIISIITLIFDITYFENLFEKIVGAFLIFDFLDNNIYLIDYSKLLLLVYFFD